MQLTIGELYFTAFIAILILLAIFIARLRDSKKMQIAQSYVYGLMGRGFSEREISMCTEISEKMITAWRDAHGPCPQDKDLKALIGMTRQANNSFINLHQAEMARRSRAAMARQSTEHLRQG